MSTLLYQRRIWAFHGNSQMMCAEDPGDLSSLPMLWQGPPLTLAIEGTQSLFSVPPTHWSQYHCKVRVR